MGQVEFIPEKKDSNVGKVRITLEVKDYMKGNGEGSIHFYRSGVVQHGNDLTWSDQHMLHAYEPGEHLVIQLIKKETADEKFYILNGLIDGKYRLVNGNVEHTSVSTNDLKQWIGSVNKGDGGLEQLKQVIQAKSKRVAHHKQTGKQTASLGETDSPTTQATCYEKGRNNPYWNAFGDQFIDEEYLAWDKSYLPVMYYYDTKNAPSTSIVTDSEMEDVMLEAFSGWENIPNLGMNFSTDAQWAYPGGTPDGEMINVLRWDDALASDKNAETTTYPTDYKNNDPSVDQFKNGINGSLIKLNKQKASDFHYDHLTPPSSRTSSSIDLVEVLMHELGHVQGLHHFTDYKTNLMHEDYLGRGTNIRQMSDYDMAGAVFKHPDNNMSGTLALPLFIGQYHDETLDIGSINSDGEDLRFVRGTVNLPTSSIVMAVSNSSLVVDENPDCSFTITGDAASQIKVNSDQDFLNGAADVVNGPNVVIDTKTQTATNTTIQGSAVTFTGGGKLVVSSGATIKNSSVNTSNGLITVVSGGLLDNADITIENGEFRGNADNTIAVNTDFTVKSGGTFKSGGFYRPYFNFGQSEGILVQGTGHLNVDRVIFRSSGTHQWNGIHVDKDAQLTLNKATVRDANWGLYLDHLVTETDITNSTFKNNELYAIYSNNADLFMKASNVVDNDGHGIYTTGNDGGTHRIVHAQVRNNQYGVITLYNRVDFMEYDDSNYRSNLIMTGNEIGIDASGHSYVVEGNTDGFGDQVGGNSDLSSNTVWAVRANNESVVDAEYAWWGNGIMPSNVIYENGGASVNYANKLTSDPYPSYGENEKIDYPALVLSEDMEKTDNNNQTVSDEPIISKLDFIDRYSQRVDLDRTQATKFAVQHVSNSDKSIADAAKLAHVSITRQSDSRQAIQLAEQYVAEGSFSLLEKELLAKKLFHIYLNDLSEYDGAQQQYALLSTMDLDPIELTSFEKKYEVVAGVLPGDYIAPNSAGSSINDTNESIVLSNYPNPFNPTTNIQYQLNREGPVSLTVYNIAGQVVAKLVDKVQDKGKHSVSFDASNLSSGIYLYRLTTPVNVITNKMTVLK